MISDNRNMLQELNADLNERVPSAEYARIVKEFETLTKRVSLCYRTLNNGE